MTKQEPVGKPFAGYDDFDSCVADNPDKEDPEAFCGWLQDRAKDLADSDADTVLVDLTTEFVSSVDNPAQRSEWVIRKDADVSRRNASEVERPFVLADDLASKAADVDVRAENSDGDRQIAYAAVLVPDEVDKQGDVVPPYVVERSAHEYLAEYRKMDTDHDLEDGAGTPVESWILKDDTSFETPDGDTVEYPAGTWILGKRFVDSEWKRVQSGELTGFSIYGGGEAIDVDKIMKQTSKQEEDPCEDGWTMVGTKPNPNGSGEVPRCVPEEDVDEPPDLGSTNAGLPDDFDADTFDPDAASTGKNDDETLRMKQTLHEAVESESPRETIADEIRRTKAHMSDEDAEAVVDMLQDAVDAVQDAVDESPESDTSGMPGEDDESMSDKEDANDDGDGDVAEGIDELKSMVKGVDSKVDDFDDRLDEVEQEVDALKSAVGDDVPNDRLDDGGVDDDVSNDRMKSVARDAVAEVAGVDSNDPEVVRKALVEQVDSDETPDLAEDYSDVVDDDAATGGNGGGRTIRNKRFAGEK